jgi:predicted permease
MAILENFLLDVRYAFRGLARNRLLTCAVVSTLVIGIGLNAAMFAVVNGMVFRARIEKDPKTFVQILTEYSSSYVSHGDPWKTSLADYHAFETAKTVESLEAWAIAHVTIDDDPRDNLAMLVTCRFFSLYDLENPKLGRVFQENECAVPGSAPVVVIGGELWKRRFGSDPKIVGRSILLNHHPYTIVGVVPGGFSGRLRGGGLWIPYTMQSQFFAGTDLFADVGTPWLTVEGRIAPTHSRSEALAELSSIVHAEDKMYQGRETSLILTDGSTMQHPASGAIVKWVVPLLLGAFALILVLACTNVTMLLLSRAAARQREMAIRLSLGAERARLVRMLLTEGLLLAVIAGGLSAGVTYGVPSLFEHVMWRAPHYIVKPDWLVFSYLAVLTMLAGMVTGLAPAAESFKLNLTGSLKDQQSAFGKGTARWRTRDILIAAQVATSLVLLIGAAFFARAELSMVTADPGFETRQVLQVPLKARAPSPRALEERIKTLPGVRSVCYASIPPLAGRTPQILTVGNTSAALNSVSPSCFETLGISMVRGRADLDGDSVVVSEELAKRVWPGKDPIGKAVRTNDGSDLKVAGIARNLTYIHLGSVDVPTIYQRRIQDSSGDALLVRFDGAAELTALSISRIMTDLDPNQTGIPYRLSTQIAEMASRFVVIEGVVVVLGGVALVLAVVGIYGVVGFAVLRRTKELGIRLALGATTADLIRCVVGPGFKPVLAGLAVGAALTIVGSAGLQKIFQHSPVSMNVFDPLPYGVVCILLAGVAVAAMFAPALRAAYGSPAKALRED